MPDTSPDKIWIITREEPITRPVSGSRDGGDTGGYRYGLDEKPMETVETGAKLVEVAQMKAEMTRFLRAMREMLDEADPPESKIRLEEVELSVEINGEGKVMLFGIGGKMGGKGAMTFKFKRKDG